MMSDSSLVCKHAADFSSKAILSDGTVSENFNLKEYIQGQYCVLFFYPLDFTFVCPTEIIAFSNRVGEFRALNTEVIGVSVDSHFTHKAWRNTPLEDGGVGEINFPLVGDLSKSISRDYGVLLDESIALRATFIIDRNFIIRHQSVNDLPLGRNVDEILRLIRALQHTEEHGEVCPAGWSDKEEGIKPNAESVSKYLSKHSKDL